MNMNNNPNKRQLRSLLFACDDLAGHHVLWVSRMGEVCITRLGNDTLEQWAERMESQIRFHYEMFEPGNQRVGPTAASNAEYITQTFYGLLKDWNDDKEGSLSLEREPGT